MPNPVPGAQQLADGATGAVPATPGRRWRLRRPKGRPRLSRRVMWRWLGVAGFALVVVVLFDAFLHLSKTYPENSDEANILLMADDMLHGNVYLSGWNVSDVPFITTELPQMALLVWLFGLHLNTAHIAAALTYTLVVAVAMLLARGRATGWAAVTRMALAVAIMLAPQPGVGVFVAIFSVGHIGTALPVMLAWLVLDRFGVRWYSALIMGLLLAWALMADPLVLVIAIYPMLVVCLVRLVTGLISTVRNGPGHRSPRAVLLATWPALALAAAAGASYAIVVWARDLLSGAGGYVQQPVPFALAPLRTWFWHAKVVTHGLLTMFGAYFVTGQDPQQPLTRMDQVIAASRLVCVLLAVWGACAIARRFFRRDADLISQLLLVGIIANLAAYIPSTLAAHTALNTREIAPVLPFAAVLAGRMLGDRVVGWVRQAPKVRLRLPRLPKMHPRKLSVSLLAVPLLALLGWYSYGLFRQADAPAAPEPLTQLAASLEANHLTYGLGGYWMASVITVETGGAVTIRAVTPACMQPYTWESKPDWYNPDRHYAGFILLSNVPGYFNKFSLNGAALDLLTQWERAVTFPWPQKLTFGAWHPVLVNGKPARQYDYEVRDYSFENLLTQLPALKVALSTPQAPC